MIYISEEESSALVSHEMAYEAAREALIGACETASNLFPVVLGYASERTNRFTIKSGSNATLAGLKVGTYFPSNDLADLPRHSSIILLFDQAKGRVGAIVEGSRLNAYRTAAADAVATAVLSRPDAKVLAIFGNGHQAAYDVEAVLRIRSIRKILVVGRSEDRTEAFASKMRDAGLPAKTCTAEKACKDADIIITATTSTTPLFNAEWVRPGTHISCMGSDAVGKQELPPNIFGRAHLFCDIPEQSVRIGEFQHTEDGRRIAPIGSVLSGTVPGRRTPEDITIFDSSGISLQDLYIADRIVAAFKNRHCSEG